MLGSILGSPHFGKLPSRDEAWLLNLGSPFKAGKRGVMLRVVRYRIPLRRSMLTANPEGIL